MTHLDTLRSVGQAAGLDHSAAMEVLNGFPDWHAWRGLDSPVDGEHLDRFRAACQNRAHGIALGVGL